MRSPLTSSRLHGVISEKIELFKPLCYVGFGILTAVVMKSPLTSSRLHGVISEKIELFKPLCYVGFGILRAMVMRRSIF
jgi:hypothetical protein